MVLTVHISKDLAEELRSILEYQYHIDEVYFGKLLKELEYAISEDE